jgi:membrane-associated phospholipid phosphatase
MKINRKLQNISLIIVSGIALIGFIIGSFLDQKITGKMGDFDNLFGILFTALGPVLTLAFGVLAGSLLFFMDKLENKTWNIIFRVIGAAAIFGFVFSQVKEGLEYVDFPIMKSEKTTYQVLILVFITLIDLTIILFSRIWIRKIEQRNLIVVCLMIISLIAIYFVVCEAVKYLASRPRPRVLEYSLTAKFKQWYQWKPFAAFTKDFHDCKSFVSGHAANAACLITILPLVASLPKRENNNLIQIMSAVIGALFVFIVAFSRIVAKAHWMTDVMGGIILSCGMQAVVINVTPLILKKIE